MHSGHNQLMKSSPQEREQSQEKPKQEPKQEGPFSSASDVHGLRYTCSQLGVAALADSKLLTTCRPWHACDSVPAKAGRALTWLKGRINPVSHIRESVWVGDVAL